MKHFDPNPFEVAERVRELGARIRVARTRRKIDQAELARTSRMARTTLQRIEAGRPECSIGAIYTVLWALGLLATTDGVADPDSDEHGKTLEAARRVRRVHHPRTASDENNF